MPPAAPHPTVKLQSSPAPGQAPGLPVGSRAAHDQARQGRAGARCPTQTGLPAHSAPRRAIQTPWQVLTRMPRAPASPKRRGCQHAGCQQNRRKSLAAAARAHGLPRHTRPPAPGGPGLCAQRLRHPGRRRCGLGTGCKYTAMQNSRQTKIEKPRPGRAQCNSTALRSARTHDQPQSACKAESHRSLGGRHPPASSLPRIKPDVFALTGPSKWLSASSNASAAAQAAPGLLDPSAKP